jgi:hypothetical protein
VRGPGDGPADAGACDTASAATTAPVVASRKTAESKVRHHKEPARIIASRGLPRQKGQPMLLHKVKDHALVDFNVTIDAEDRTTHRNVLFRRAKDRPPLLS